LRAWGAEAGISLVAIALFLGVWAMAAAQIQTSLGRVPGPVEVFVQAGNLMQEHAAERAKRAAFYRKQAEHQAALLAQDRTAEVKKRRYTGKPTYLDQIATSLRTVFAGFLIASLIALPIGILCGVNRFVMRALNLLIQILKPVSPVAWLPVVTMIVSAVYAKEHAFFPKSYIISAVTVALCSLWPSLINTSLAVASIDKDYVNVGRVLQLGFFARIFKIVIPASLPLIFTGLRISLGVGWMVLIAAEMLAQNPGLGKFIWDEFQNGSSQSLARIMVAVFTIGIIGFLLDRVMVMLQRLVSVGHQTEGA
jgi:nitrate/nitrite transport system permease protein